MTPRPAILACAALALALARRRPALRPAAVALTTLAAIDGARFLPLPGRVDAALWLVWPGVPAALAWSVWSVNGGRWVAIVFAVYAAAIALAPWSWASHPIAWTVARSLPYVVAPCLGVVAWALKDERPGGFPSNLSGPMAIADRLGRPPHCQPLGPGVAPCEVARDSGSAAGQRGSEVEYTHADPAAQASRRVAAILLASATIDAIVLLPSLDAASWSIAAPLAWCTWIACGAVIVMGARRPRVVS